MVAGRIFCWKMEQLLNIGVFSQEAESGRSCLRNGIQAADDRQRIDLMTPPQEKIKSVKLITWEVPHWKEVLCVWGQKAKWTVKYATKDKKERIDKPARISCQVKTKLFRGLKNFNKLENARRVVWLLRWKFMCWLDFDITIKIYWTVN